jgi:hypothetical protein
VHWSWSPIDAREMWSPMDARDVSKNWPWLGGSDW